MEKGFMKVMILAVIGFCIFFMVIVVVAQSVGPSSGNTLSLSDYFNSEPVDYFGGDSYTDPLSGGTDYWSDTGAGYDAPPDEGGTTDTTRSPYANTISLNGGNASYSDQPFEEYVTINNFGPPVNISGWTLTNSKGARPVQNSQNTYFYPTPDVAVIGQGTEFLDPSGYFVISSIILDQGDTAIVTTGGPFANFPFSLYTSFRVNTCGGYLKNYPFEPALPVSCPDMSRDPLINTVTDECYDYITTIYGCMDPARDDKERFDGLTSQCRNFISARTSYKSCVDTYRNSPGFETKEWRVYLGKKRELWATRRETITLYDNKGLVVSQLSY